MFRKWFAKSARSVPLRAYGKLPFAAEYRRIGSDTGTAAAFTRWLDEGRAALLSREPGAQLLTSTLCVPFGAGREWVMARLWDSRDSLGRKFPFCFFVVCPQADMGDGPLERLGATVHYARAFDAAWRERGSLSGRDFAKVYGDFAIDPPPERAAAETAELRRAAEAWESAAGDGDPSAIGVSAAASRIGEVRQSGGVRRFCGALSAAGSAEAQAAAWLSWLEPALRAAQAPAWFIVNEASGAAARPRVSVGLSDLEPADYDALADVAKRGDCLCVRLDHPAGVRPAAWLAQHRVG